MKTVTKKVGEFTKEEVEHECQKHKRGNPFSLKESCQIACFDCPFFISHEGAMVCACLAVLHHAPINAEITLEVEE